MEPSDAVISMLPPPTTCLLSNLDRRLFSASNFSGVAPASGGAVMESVPRNCAYEYKMSSVFGMINLVVLAGAVCGTCIIEGGGPFPICAGRREVREGVGGYAWVLSELDGVMMFVRFVLRAKEGFNSSGMGDGNEGVADGIDMGEISEMGSKDSEKLDVDALGVDANGNIASGGRKS